jgi:hypothetical protein
MELMKEMRIKMRRTTVVVILIASRKICLCPR